MQRTGTILLLADGTIQACDAIAAQLLGYRIDQLIDQLIGQTLDQFTALCAETETKFLLRATLRAALNKNFVPHALAKRCTWYPLHCNSYLTTAEHPVTITLGPGQRVSSFAEIF